MGGSLYQHKKIISLEINIDNFRTEAQTEVL